MRESLKARVKRIYLEVKGTCYKNLSGDQKTFLEYLQKQAYIMRDFCKPLSDDVIKEIIMECKNDIQLEVFLRPLKLSA